MIINRIIWGFLVCWAGVLLYSCKDKTTEPTPVSTFNYTSVTVNGLDNGFAYTNINLNPILKFTFSEAVDKKSVVGSFSFKDNTGANIAFRVGYEDNNKTIVIQPDKPLAAFSRFTVGVTNALLSENQARLKTPLSITLQTGVDDIDKFPRISDEELLTLVQQQTFRYFWDFGHPVSGLARERNTSGDVVTSGGSGFGIMALITGVHRHFISRAEGLTRLQQIVSFLQHKADRFHGAFPHWLNGNTGKTVAFSAQDNGADLVETAFLMQGLLTARQYFNNADPAETALRNDINALWQAVEWTWFQKNQENKLYWHWSPDYNWQMNMPVRGWNEALITYVLAASSPAHPISKVVYDEGWAQNGAMRNGNSYYGIQLPLGPSNGGPLFFAHYSFLGINPTNLSDAYANYQVQNTAHTLINYNYCRANPKNYYGYSESCWGLTASDDPNGYLAHEPQNDNGVISPTAALSSFPYTPNESMAALKFFYYKLGNKIWQEYGFVDAFSLHHNWYADSFLAIDQGPIIIMIENYRSNLLWNLFMSCPEVKVGMKNLGFQSPHL